MVKDEKLKKILELYKRPGGETEVEEILHLFNGDRREAIEAMKRLDDQREGRFTVGRGRNRTRIVWVNTARHSEVHAQTTTAVPLPLPQSKAAQLETYKVKLPNSDVPVELRLPMELKEEDVERIHQFLRFHAGLS